MSGLSGEADVTSCYRHDGIRAGVICQRCDRPICSECMHQASVGFHCPECVKGAGQTIHRGVPAFDPIATKVLIGLNVLAFLWSSAQSGSLMRLDLFVLFDFGLFGGDGLGSGIANGEWYRIVTAGFLHNGLIHLGFNMYALWVLGPQLERLLHRPRFLALYTAAMVGGAAGVMLLQPNRFTVGASGAVFGLFGAVAVIQRAAGFNIWESGIGQVLLINFIITFAIPQISIGGHVGGFLAGALIGAVYIKLIRARKSDWTGFAVAAVITVVFLVVTVVLAANPLV